MNTASLTYLVKENDNNCCYPGSVELSGNVCVVEYRKC